MLTDQPKEVDRFLKFNLVYILTTVCADGIGLILGSVLNPVVRIKIIFYSIIQCNVLLRNCRMEHLSEQRCHRSCSPLADLLHFTVTYRSR